MKKIIRIFILIILWILCEVWLLDVLQIKGMIRVELSIITIIYFSIYNGAAAGSLLGFGLGLLQDSAMSSYLGAGTLAKTLLGFIFGKGKERVFIDNISTQMIVVFVGIIAHNILFAFFVFIRDGLLYQQWQLLPSIKELLLFYTIQNGLYSAIIAPILLAISHFVLHLSLHIER